jgi:hypothetical protein
MRAGEGIGGSKIGKEEEEGGGGEDSIIGFSRDHGKQ